MKSSSPITAFQKYLGGHPEADRHDLTLPELGALVVVAGRKESFTVKTEVPVNTGGNPPRIDCAWCSKGKNGKDIVVVAWEFDACNVGRAHVEGTPKKKRTAKRWGTFEKLSKFPKAIKIQALYRIRGEVMKDGPALKEEKKGRKKISIPDGIEVLTDKQLMEGEIVAIAERAAKLARVRVR